MKKNFLKKKLASALALALVVASVYPAGISASAATAAKIVDKSAKTATTVLYVDKVSYGKSAVNFDLSKTYTGTTYTWTVSNSKLATIGAKTGYVVAKAPGVVTVKVTAKTKAGKTSTVTTKVTIRKRATAVAAGEDVTLTVGETKAQVAKVTPSNTTDAVRYYSSDEKVATVDVKTGAVTAVKTGEATITVYAKAAWQAANDSKYNVSDSYKVTVTNSITKVAPVTPKKIAVTFGESLTGTTYTKDNFVVLTSDTSTKNYIKAITTSTDGKTVTLEFYNELTSGKTYDVTATFGSLVLKGSTPFVKGAVAKIEGANQIVLADATGTNAQAIAYTVYDENGLDITDSTAVSFESNVSVTGGKISIGHGVLAYVTVVYTNPTTGAQIKSNTFSVTGSNAVATSTAGYTLSSTTVTSWPTTVTNSIAINTTKYAYVKAADQYNVSKIYGFNATSGAAFESLDPSIFVIDATTGLVTPVAVGAGQFKVTIGSVTQIYSITVTAQAKATSLSLDSTSVTKASKTNPSVNFANLLVNVIDQNSSKLTTDTTSSTLTATLINSDGAGVVSLTNGGTSVAVNAPINLPTTGLKLYAVSAGTAVFKITSANSSLPYITVSVSVYSADPVIVNYGLTGVADLDINNAYDGDSDTSPTASIAVAAKNAGGFVVDTITGASIKLVDPSGDTTTVTGGALTVDVTGNANETGTYQLSAIVNGATIATASFKVVDTDTQPNVYLTSNTLNVTTTSLVSIVNNDYDSFVGIKFLSGDISRIASQTIPTTTLSFSGTDPVYLYNVVIVVVKDGRQFSIATNTTLKLTK